MYSLTLHYITVVCDHEEEVFTMKKTRSSVI